MSSSNQISRSVRRQARNVLYTGRRFNAFEQIRERHQWSTHALTVDANQYIPSGVREVFTTPVGQRGQGFAQELTLRETNWSSANRVPDNQNFEIKEVGVTPFALVRQAGAPNIERGPVNPQDHKQICDNIVVAIKYLTNVIPIGTVGDFAQPAGPTMGNYSPYYNDPDLQPDNRAFSGYVTNGFPAPALRRRFKIPILLQHGETFSFQFLVKRSFWSTQEAGTQIGLRLDLWAVESFVERS